MQRTKNPHITRSNRAYCFTCKEYNCGKLFAWDEGYSDAQDDMRREVERNMGPSDAQIQCDAERDGEILGLSEELENVNSQLQKATTRIAELENTLSCFGSTSFSVKTNGNT